MLERHPPLLLRRALQRSSARCHCFLAAYAPPSVAPKGTLRCSSSSSSSDSTSSMRKRRGSDDALLPVLDVSPLLNPSQYCRRSAKPGGIKTISGSEAMKRLIDGRAALIDEMQRGLYDGREDGSIGGYGEGGDGGETQDRTKPTKGNAQDEGEDKDEVLKKGDMERNDARTSRMCVLKGHGVPTQLFQHLLNVASSTSPCPENGGTIVDGGWLRGLVSSHDNDDDAVIEELTVRNFCIDDDAVIGQGEEERGEEEENPSSMPRPSSSLSLSSLLPWDRNVHIRTQSGETAIRPWPAQFDNDLELFIVVAHRLASHLTAAFRFDDATDGSDREEVVDRSCGDYGSANDVGKDGRFESEPFDIIRQNSASEGGGTLVRWAASITRTAAVEPHRIPRGIRLSPIVEWVLTDDNCGQVRVCLQDHTRLVSSLSEVEGKEELVEGERRSGVSLVFDSHWMR